MKKINIAITGCLGRMGQQLIKSVKKDKDFKLVALTENKKMNKTINGLKINCNEEQIFKNAQLIIDFTIPKCTFQVLKIATKCVIIVDLLKPKLKGKIILNHC